MFRDLIKVGLTVYVMFVVVVCQVRNDFTGENDLYDVSEMACHESCLDRVAKDRSA